MTIEIQLKHGVVLFDDCDIPLLGDKWWYSVQSRPTCTYAEHSWRVGKVVKHVKMHHLISPLYDSKLIVDHINGNGLDNRRCNLRYVTPRQNSQNRHHAKTSKYPGVCWNKRNQNWNTFIKLGDTITYLGSFFDEDIAYVAYLAAIPEKDLISITTNSNVEV